jgi:hypothetical protein
MSITKKKSIHEKKNIRLAIIHFMPLEIYPPITNLLDYIETENIKKISKIQVFSCYNIKNTKTFKTKNIKILRFPNPKENDNIIFRFIKHLIFNLGTLIYLIKLKPNRLIYYESFSAGAAWLYLRWIRTNCKLFIHNHEYNSPEWYSEKSMKTTSYYHKKEIQFLYKKAEWISHTNKDRLELFRNDFPFVEINKTYILPNYPPKKYLVTSERNTTAQAPIKTVYIGTLSLFCTYIKEYCNWIIHQKGNVTLDIFSYLCDEPSSKYIEKISSPYIHFYKEGIDYKQIFEILKNYNVGLILYKAENENYIFNAPNKLFEYYACGLDVWFPAEMKGCMPYITKDSYPKIIKIDFKNLKGLNLSDITNKTGLSWKPSGYYYEKEYSALVNNLLQ